MRIEWSGSYLLYGSNLMLTGPWTAVKDLEMFLWSSSDSNYKKKSALECLDFWVYCLFSMCVCVLGVGHGAAEPGEQAVNRISRQWTSSVGHHLPGGGEEEHSWTLFSMPAALLTVTAWYWEEHGS